MALRIVVDENVTLAREAFGGLGDVRLAPGRSIDAAAVSDADVLVVRSVTRVDEALLRDSPVRFVGTATVGTDHLDLEWLASRGIAVASAPGSNARAVAEWVVAALLEAEVAARPWSGRLLGIVGVGHVGRAVETLAPFVGLEVLRCDPPRADVEGSAGFAPLEQVLAECDAVTLHVPLVVGGSHPTRPLLGESGLRAMRPGALLLNASRGATVDGAALRDAMARGRRAALDVFEGEPEPDPEVVRGAIVATPHVAGYSLDGKVAGTRQVARALAAHLGIGPGALAATETVRPADVVGRPGVRVFGSGRDALREAVRAACPIGAMAARFRETLGLPPGGRGRAFDAMRRDLPERREFPAWLVNGPDLSTADRKALAGLGFALDPAVGACADPAGE